MLFIRAHDLFSTPAEIHQLFHLVGEFQVVVLLPVSEFAKEKPVSYTCARAIHSHAETPGIGDVARWPRPVCHIDMLSRHHCESYVRYTW
jgi:hypothetical protein